MAYIYSSLEKQKFSKSASKFPSRRYALLGISGLVLTACGGGDSPGSSSPNPPPANNGSLKSTEYASGVSAAKATVLNANDDGFALWVDPSSNKLSQASYSEGGKKKYTIIYDANQAVQRVINESDGSFLDVTVVNATRTDFNLYAANGQWQSGYSIVQAADGSFSSASIVNSPAISGQQIGIETTGGLTASMSLVPSGTAGLGSPKKITAGGSPLLLSANELTQPVFAKRKLLDLLVGNAYAQTSVASGVKSSIFGAFLAAAGGIALAGAATPTVALAGIALLGLGAYQIYTSLKGIQDGGLDVLDAASGAILADSFVNLGKGSDPLQSLKDKINSYLGSGGSALPKVDNFKALLVNAVSNVQSTLQAVNTAALAQITSKPPVGDTQLEGLAVDNTGASYSVTGLYQPSTDVVSFQSNVVNGNQIKGSVGLTSRTGTYQVIGSGVTGAASTTVQTLGSCQTIQSSGGKGTFSKVYDLGADSGTFSLDYQMYTITDGMVIRDSKGNEIFTTGGLVSGGKTQNVKYSNGRLIFVTLYAPNDGTAWDYRIGCPT